MSDIATLWNTVRGDWILVGGDLAKGNDIVSAPDDVPPDGASDHRGWWADDPTHPIGSRLWLLSRSKRTDATLNSAIAYVEEALAWMLEDGVASKVEVSAEWSAARTLGVWVIIYAPRTSAPIARIGVQNLYGVAHAQAWSWSGDQERGAWAPITL